MQVPDFKGKKEPTSLSGKVAIDRQTGVPIRANLQGTLLIPHTSGPPGTIKLSLRFTLKPGNGNEVLPGEFVPTIRRRENDIDALSFLDGGTRTSTIIGGRRPSSAKKKK